MVQSQLKTLRKKRRERLTQENKTLKNRKNWYQVSDSKRHFKRKVKAPRPPRVRKDLIPGQILILLSGRFRGRRVVYLKSLKSGLLLVTGPYKLNGVPLKRVNAAYVIPTRTNIKLPTLSTLESVNDLFFKKQDEKKSWR